MADKILLTAENISAGYDKKEVIHDISFSVKAGSLCALIGANGSGKTTLMKCIAGQLAHSGSCTLGTEKLEDMTLRELARKLSYIPQKSGVSISLPCLDVVMMGFNPVLKLMQRPTKEMKRQALEAMSAMGINDMADVDYQKLSEGQKQLVILARTLIENTSLMLLDEPDSALDIQNRNNMMKLLKHMVSDCGRAGILCLHDPILALNYCEQLVLLKDGFCTKVLEPAKASVEEMEAALKELYGDISLVECSGKSGRRKLVALWEDDE